MTDVSLEITILEYINPIVNYKIEIKKCNYIEIKKCNYDVYIIVYAKKSLRQWSYIETIHQINNVFRLKSINDKKLISTLINSNYFDINFNKKSQEFIFELNNNSKLLIL